MSIEYDAAFKKNLRKYLDAFSKRADYCETFADQLENNPLLAADYLRRAFLISGNPSLAQKALEILQSAEIEGRAKNSVEMLLSQSIERSVRH